jgi:predicted TIM-barrel fold metal-dependent hydrolase
MPPAIIDAHHHLWDTRINLYPYLTDGSRDRMHGKPLPRVYTIDDFLADTQAAKLKASVHIQCGWNPADPVGETTWLQQIADRHGFPHAIVAHADLASPAVEEMLEAHCRHANMRGIRQHVGWHAEPQRRLTQDPALMRNPNWRRGFGLLRKYNLSFDLQIYPEQAEDAVALGTAFPETPLVIGNLAMPDSDIAAWRTAIVRLAILPNATIKLSGAGMLAKGRSIADFIPIIRHAIHSFGPERCLFASNFPVDRLFLSYDSWVAAVSEAARDLSDSDREAIFAGNAARVYRLAH